jgi:long-chain acyl-CoA synthetase
MNCPDHNLVALHERQSARLGPRPAVRFKRLGLYHDLSWQRYWDWSQACAAALVDAGIEPGERVGLLSENRLEWLIADMGILAAAAVNVPPHAPLAPAQLQYQFDHAELRWLFVSTPELLNKVRQIRGQLPRLRRVVVFEPVQGDDVIPWPAFIMRGRVAVERLAPELRKRREKLTGDDLATIMYTSGTTGNPKGVMLTHDNLLSNAASVAEHGHIEEDKVVLSWLPYSHIYGRLVDHYVSLAAGSTLALAESQETLVQNLEEIQPHFFSAVPRFYEKLLAAVPVGDRLRKIFGSRIQWLNSGGAPLPLHIAEAYHQAGLPLLQGYGLTESSPVITFNRREKNRLGTVGVALPGVEVRVAKDGEVLTRGPHVMKGYWKEPQATADAITDGWLCTGDLGSLDADGFLAITGRKKDLLVLSNGKKVVPTHLEGLLAADECIDQAVVHGEGKNFLTALIVPRFDNLKAAARTAGVAEVAQVAQLPNEELVNHPTVKELMARRIDAALADVSDWEKVKKFILLPRPFTLDAEELTVSLKLRRGFVIEKYRRELERLYE